MMGNQPEDVYVGIFGCQGTRLGRHLYTERFIDFVGAKYMTRVRNGDNFPGCPDNIDTAVVERRKNGKLVRYHLVGFPHFCNRGDGDYRSLQIIAEWIYRARAQNIHLTAAVGFLDDFNQLSHPSQRCLLRLVVSHNPGSHILRQQSFLSNTEMLAHQNRLFKSIIQNSFVLGFEESLSRARGVVEGTIAGKRAIETAKIHKDLDWSVTESLTVQLLDAEQTQDRERMRDIIAVLAEANHKHLEGTHEDAKFSSQSEQKAAFVCQEGFVLDYERSTQARKFVTDSLPPQQPKAVDGQPSSSREDIFVPAQTKKISGKMLQRLGSQSSHDLAQIEIMLTKMLTDVSVLRDLQKTSGSSLSGEDEFRTPDKFAGKGSAEYAGELTQLQEWEQHISTWKSYVKEASSLSLQQVSESLEVEDLGNLTVTDFGKSGNGSLNKTSDKSSFGTKSVDTPPLPGDDLIDSEDPQKGRRSGAPEWQAELAASSLKRGDAESYDESVHGYCFTIASEYGQW